MQKLEEKKDICLQITAVFARNGLKVERMMSKMTQNGRNVGTAVSLPFARIEWERVVWERSCRTCTEIYDGALGNYSQFDRAV